jgi:regulator of RNase E activity RraA
LLTALLLLQASYDYVPTPTPSSKGMGEVSTLSCGLGKNNKDYSRPIPTVSAGGIIMVQARGECDDLVHWD